MEILKESKCVFMWDQSFSNVSLLSGETETDAIKANSDGNSLFGIEDRQVNLCFSSSKFVKKKHTQYKTFDVLSYDFNTIYFVMYEVVIYLHLKITFDLLRVLHFLIVGTSKH